MQIVPVDVMLMDSAADDRYRRAHALVHELVELADADRARRLDEACAEDNALRCEVEWLLASIASTAEDEVVSDEFERIIEAQAKAAFATPRIESVATARYRLIERVGEGGMGQVWLAEREQGDVRQRVALKMLRAAGADKESSVARFLEEGRILGALNHPNIAHLVEAGHDAEGAPFLAMEFVAGEPIDRWCKSRALGLRDRVGLFVKVCAALEYAHANLVIHRDLKPANILVDFNGEPKVLDFGIARLADADAKGTRAVTATQSMTMGYASPEQIEGRRLGTASDIYSLGVVLYELLVGVRPFDHLATDHARSNAIVSGEVLAPSKNPGGPIGRGRHPASPRRIPADIDAVVMKSLRREPNQRYASVADFADDLRAFLESRPVQARRGQLGYRWRRFTWRNRWLIAASLFVVSLASAFTWKTVLAEREARVQAAVSDRVAEFLVSVFEASDSNVNQSLSHGLSAREVLDSGAARIDKELADQPRIRARLLEAVGNAYRHMNANAKGVAMLRAAADIHLDPAINQPLDAARCLEALANAMANGEFPASEAESAARESLALAERHTAPGSQSVANAWMVLSLALNRSGNLAAAEQAAYTTYAMNERLLDDPANRFDAALGNLCIILSARGKLTDAEPFCLRSHERRIAGGRQVVLAMSSSRLAQLRAAQGDFEQALAFAAGGLTLTRELKGEHSQFGTVFMLREAAILDDAGRHEEAQAMLEQALTDSKALDGEDSGEYLMARAQLARHQAQVGETASSIVALRKLVPEITKRFGADDPRSLGARTDLALALLDSGVGNGEVRRMLDESLAQWDRKDDPDAPAPMRTRSALAQWLIMNGDRDQALALLDRIQSVQSRADRSVKARAGILRAQLDGR